MRTIERIFVTMATLAVLQGTSGIAAAQTVMPAPMVAPVPQTPVVVQTPVIPAPVVLPRITLDELKVIRPDIQLLLDDLKLNMPDVQVITRNALETARVAMDSLDFEKLKFDDKFKYDFDWQDSGLYVSRQGDSSYNSCKDYVVSRKYEQAIVRCDRVVVAKGDHVDGALFWKAFAQYKLGKTDDSLATIAVLRKDHAQSRYLGDAKALEADARKRGGQPVNPADADDDEMKILAIMGLQKTDPEGVIPRLEAVLTSTNSLAVKKSALYVLALSTLPRAHQILLNYAKGGANPDLQLEAIRYLTTGRDKQTTGAELVQIYQSTQDNEVKLAIITALRTTGNGAQLLTIAGSSSSPTMLRSSALNGLTGIITAQELWTLYEKETNKDLKMSMIGIFGATEAIDQLNRIVKIEKDQDLRRRAIRSLGARKPEKTGQMLVELYPGEQDVDTRKAIISALSNQNNAEGLVAIARKETTLALKTEIVRKLSELAPKSKVAADYLMEIIK